jgi:hypothetical protein
MLATRITVVTAVVLAGAAAPAFAIPQETDVLAPKVVAQQTQDLRAPDQVAPAGATQSPRAPGHVAAATKAGVTPSTARDGFDWGDAGIGAGSVAVAMGLAGSVLLVARRRHDGTLTVTR